MKSKKNSKKEYNSLNTISMLLQKQDKKRILSQVPTNMSSSTINIDISHNQISSLRGIQRYKLLKVLKISHNNLSQFEEFQFLEECMDLEELWIQQNPICEKVNYLYGVFCMLNKVIRINGLTFTQSLGQLSKWSTQNGIKLVQFLMQSCVIINQRQKNTHNINNRNINRQLLIMKKLFNRIQIQKYGNNQLIKYVNENMQNHLVLDSLQVPDLDQNQIKDIKDYIFDKIIEIGSSANSQFITNLLNQIQVNGEEEEKQFITKPKIVHFIIKDIIAKYFNFYNRISFNTSTSKCQDSQLRHYLSAETALQTLQTGKRAHNGLQFFHFCLDPSYLMIINDFVSQQIDRLVQITRQRQENHSQIGKVNIEVFNNQIKSYQTYQQEEFIGSPQKVFSNSVIMENILQILEDSFKKIAFRRIKHCRSSFTSNKVLMKIQSSLSYVLTKTFSQTFSLLKFIVHKQRSLQQKFKKKKLLKIFKAWKKIKQTKLKLLKTILKRKIKTDNFLSSLALVKWRMNARGQKIRQMANSIILGTSNQVMPHSKKGIQLAYRRAMHNKRSLF